MGPVQLSTTVVSSQGFRDRLKETYGADVSLCYQCGKCSAGCPAAFAMEHTVRQIIRMVQAGLIQDALRTYSIWACAGCETCSSRCPRQVDPAKVMEALRIEAKKQGLVADREADLFHDLFLQSVQSNGRLHEVGLMARFNILSRQFFKDAVHAPGLLSQGKLSILPHKNQNPDAVARIFANVKKKRGGNK
ncbi:4fe-4S ferredoxin, iron-sulfur binding protein, putative [Heliomicrobium modesticaldum Ice1]|uniref:4fe-4S ferredoxin, iron-sulfur binding protein, putative n=1 Tax=Heliobacterium modesticaldum (strain ATCC 51547 / Ice1) TaxID=498761 RepID=B0TG67_HELMI|nr:4Fe-4S dicluster domain-containing protein [Heliomicrobium modesticaldum]ABZ84563.1 4fe-4S ferredoxin, iron-sulfur binding protein, putative [Heliomicrobium modesticaldum Ice1]